MTDRELLELSAKAAGYEPVKYHLPGAVYSLDTAWLEVRKPDAPLGNCRWNPIESDSDALRLAVYLGLDLRIPSSPSQTFVQVGEKGSSPFVLERINGNPLSATRRAIVRAAAEIGKNA